MIVYLLLCSLLVPFNLWATISPHLHSEWSMRLLHGSSTVLLVPLLLTLWNGRQKLQPFAATVLAIFAAMLVAVNSWITVVGMGVRYGWLDHVMLAVAEVSVVIVFVNNRMEGLLDELLDLSKVD